MEAKQAEADSRIGIQYRQNVNLRRPVLHQAQSLVHQRVGADMYRRSRHYRGGAQRADVIVVAQRAADIAIAAFSECSPLRGLPQDLYDVPRGWSNFTLNYRLPT